MKQHLKDCYITQWTDYGTRYAWNVLERFSFLYDMKSQPLLHTDQLESSWIILCISVLIDLCFYELQDYRVIRSEAKLLASADRKKRSTWKRQERL